MTFSVGSLVIPPKYIWKFQTGHPISSMKIELLKIKQSSTSTIVQPVITGRESMSIKALAMAAGLDLSQLFQVQKRQPETQEGQFALVKNARLAEPVPATQTPLSDFGLYKCETCEKMVMGFDRENHAQEAHKGKGGEWVKVKGWLPK